MSCTNSPLLILCAFLCFNFYWRYIFFIPTLPVKSFKRKVCSSGLKIDKAPLLLYILLTGYYFVGYIYFLTCTFTFIPACSDTCLLPSPLPLCYICTHFSKLIVGKVIWEPDLLSFLSLCFSHTYMYFCDFHTWVFQTEEVLGNHCSLFLYLLPAMLEYKLFKPLHRAS